MVKDWVQEYVGESISTGYLYPHCRRGQDGYRILPVYSLVLGTGHVPSYSNAGGGGGRGKSFAWEVQDTRAVCMTW